MVSPANSGDGPSLRQILKDETAPLHDRLDSRLAGMATGSRSEYVAFLMIQYAARASIEEWAADHVEPNLCPPTMSGLISSDLSALGADLPPQMTFDMPQNADPLGLAWALGGSALGNKALLAERRRSGAEGSDAFLSDKSMARYFSALLPHLQAAPKNAGIAVASAAAVFETFLAAADAYSYEAAE